MGTKHLLARALAALLLTLAAAHAALAAPEYRVTVVGPPDSRANGINQAGVVVGVYATNAAFTRGFLRRGRDWVDLPAIGVSSAAVAINDKGEVLIDPSEGWNIQIPRDINDAGQIAATATRGGPYYAVRLDPIRPNLTLPPAFSPEEESERTNPVMTPEQAAVEARLDVEAQAREVVHPIQQ